MFGFGRWRRWVCNLCDEICRRSLCKTIYEDANKWYLDEDVEPQAEAEEYSSAIFEPQLLLILVVADTGEIGFELRNCESMSQWKCDV